MSDGNGAVIVGDPPVVGVLPSTFPDGQESYTLEAGELAGIIVIYVVLAFNLVVVAYACVRSRSYAPLRAKQPYVALFSALAGTAWVSGSLLSNRVFPYYPGISAGLCTFVNVWLFMVFGLLAFSTAFIFRLWRLMVLFRGLDARHSLWRSLYIPTALFYLPAVLLGIVGVALNQTVLIQLDSGHVICYSFDLQVNLSVGVVGFHIAVLIVLGFLLRNISFKYYNEYKSIGITLLAVVIVYAASFVLVLFKLHYVQWGRVLISVMYAIIVSITVLMQLAVPVYNALFNADEYEEKFMMELRKVDLSSSGSGTGHSKSVVSPTGGSKSALEPQAVSPATSTVDDELNAYLQKAAELDQDAV